MNSTSWTRQLLSNNCHTMMNLVVYSNIYCKDCGLICIIMCLLYLVLNNQIMIFRETYLYDYCPLIIDIQVNFFDIIDLLPSVVMGRSK
jgi:hypothetical protein